MALSRDVRQVTIIDLPAGFTSDALQDEITEHLQSAQKGLAINMTAITFMESSGLGALVTAYKACDSHGRSIIFYGVQPYVTQLLELTKLNHVLTTAKDEAEALQAIGA